MISSFRLRLVAQSPRFLRYYFILSGQFEPPLFLRLLPLDGY